MSTAYLYFDGGENAGLGHATRSVALSESLETLGYKCHYLVPVRSNIKELLTKHGRTVIECNPTPESIISACDTTSTGIVLIVDSYKIDFELLAFIKPHEFRLVCFDDMANRRLPVDLVINGSPSSIGVDYPSLGAQKCLLGPKYQIVRHDLILRRNRRYDFPPKNLLVTIGGSDPLNIRQKLADFIIKEICARRSTLNVDMILGPFQKNFKLEQPKNFCLRGAPDDFPTFMANADLAISAGGQTIFELACCGIPTLAFAVGENQLPNLHALQSLNAIKYVGKAQDEDWLENLFSGVSDLIEKSRIRQNISINASRIIDGKGSVRVANTIKELKY